MCRNRQNSRKISTFVLFQVFSNNEQIYFRLQCHTERESSECTDTGSAALGVARLVLVRGRRVEHQRSVSPIGSPNYHPEQPLPNYWHVHLTHLTIDQPLFGLLADWC